MELRKGPDSRSEEIEGDWRLLRALEEAQDTFSTFAFLINLSYFFRVLSIN